MTSMKTQIKFGSVWLVEHPSVPLPVPGDKPLVRHHILILDRSASMTDLASVVGHACQLIDRIPRDDYVSVGYFSGPSEYEFALLASPNSSPEANKQALQPLSRPLSTTCFSRILENLRSVISIAGRKCNLHTLLFVTDGDPVVDWGEKEEYRRCIMALREVKNLLASADFIGCGQHYNRDLLASAASACGGSLFHASTIEAYLRCATDAFSLALEAEPRRPIKVRQKEEIIRFGLVGAKVILLDDFETVYLPGNARLFSLSAVQDDAQQIFDYDETSAYAASLAALQAGRGDLALEIMSHLGDIRLCNLLSQAYSLDDVGRSEAELRDALVYSERRFLGGWKIGYTPKADAFCVLDLVELLASSQNNKLLPAHPAFLYKSRQWGKGLFVPDEDSAAPFLTGLRWSDDRLNLNILARITGRVFLGKDGLEVGLDKYWPAFVWRTYTLIRDGELNVSVLPVQVDADTFVSLQRNGLIDARYGYVPEAVHLIHLTHPLMNRATAENLNVKVAARLAVRKIHNMFRLEALNFLREKFFPPEERPTVTVTDEQAEVLVGAGIDPKTGVYRGNQSRRQPDDSYLAKVLTFTVEGFENIPSAEAVWSRTGALTANEARLAGTFDEFRQVLPQHQESWLQEEMESVQAGLQDTNFRLARVRFAVLAGHRWFDGLSQEDATYEVFGYRVRIRSAVKKVTL